jgi:uncharacterized protein (TIGR03437 family)
VTDTPVPVISADPTSLTFSAPVSTATPYSLRISFTSDSGPAAFSVSLQTGTWLKVQGASAVSMDADNFARDTGPAIGSVTQSNTTLPLLPVTVKIGGVGATLQYAGSTPGEIACSLPVNAIVPQDIAPRPAVLVTVSVGGIESQTGVTIAVK